MLNRIVAHVRCAPLADAVVGELDAAKDAPHVFTQPYTTFDHRSTAGDRGDLPPRGRPGCSVLHSVQPRRAIREPSNQEEPEYRECQS